MKKAFLITMLLFSIGIAAEILESNSIADVFDHIEQESLVIFDLDNTIITSAQSLGGDAWFSAQMEDYLENGLTNQEALAKVLPLWEALQHISEVVPVEIDTASFIKTLQSKDCSVIALTTRGYTMTNVTESQLKSVEVDFSKDSPIVGEIFFNHKAGILFKDGIIFAQGVDKGSVLIKFLEITGIEPKHIIFIDDKLKQVKSVEKSCLENNIPFTGIRYGHCDEAISNFSKEISDLQKAFYSPLLSDSKARGMINS